MSLLLYTVDRYDESTFEDDEKIMKQKKNATLNNYYLSSTDMNST